MVALGTYSWNRKGSGESAEVKIAYVWTLASGKVIRFQQHVDTAKERYLIASILIGQAPALSLATRRCPG